MTAEASRRWREANKERVREYKRNWRATQAQSPEWRAQQAEYMRQWQADHPGNNTQRAREWRERNPNWRVRNHGLTPEEFAERVKAQDGKCAICQDVPKERLRVDHDHRCCDSKFSCGKCIRGLLCAQCNAALGGFRDDPRLLEAAMRYLA